MPVDINRELDRIRAIPVVGALLATALDRIQSSVNQLGVNSGTDTQTLPAPPQIQQLNIKTDGAGTVHATIDDSNAIQKGIHYFLEYSNDPSFKQPHVVHMGASRSLPPFSLPAFDDNGNPQNWHFRAYPQYPGGNPGAPVNFGGASPTPVNPGGTMRLTLLPSTGSGTAEANGQRGGSGFGKNLFRGPVRSKRIASQ